jgi:FKBP-type peptidyl-prolyl cis-trans isomerase 2
MEMNSKIIILGLILLLFFGCVQNQSNTGVEIMIVEQGDLIKVDYKGTLEDGTQFDSSIGREPLEFTAGAGQMIKGFDSAVIGMKLHEEKNIKLNPSEAYGEVNPEAIVSVSKQQLSEAGLNNVEVGMKIFASGHPATITEVNDENVTVDFNHELAGKTLNFWIKIMEITKQ